MTREGNKSFKWIGRSVLLLLLLTIGFVLLFPFLLNSSFVKTKFTQKLKQKTGVDWEVDSLKYQGGIVSIEGLSATLDTPSKLLCIELVEIDPRWKSLLSKNIELDRVVVDKPNIILTEKILSQIAKRFKSSRSLTTVEVAKPQQKEPQQEQSSKLRQKQQPAEGVKQPAAQEQNPKPDVQPMARQKPKLPAWLYVKGGQFSLVKEVTNEELLSFENIEAKIPIDGEGLEGSLAWGNGLFQKKSIFPSGRAPILLKNNKWTTGITTNSFGLDHILKLEIGRNRLLPFAFQFHLPKQKWGFKLAERHIWSEIENVQALAQVSGYTIHPFSWRGVVNLNGEGLQLKEDLQDTELIFNRFGASLQFSGGLLYSPTVFLIGEEMSFLGNGQVNAAGQVAAVGRVIANDRMKTWLMKFSQGAVLTRGWGAAHAWMQPMPECPARWYRDIHIQSNEQTWWIDTGPKHSWVPMSLFLRMVKGFRDREIREEERKNSQNLEERGD